MYNLPLYEQPLSLYKLSAYVFVDTVNTVEDLKLLKLPDIIIRDLICKYKNKNIRDLYILLRPVIRKSRILKPIVYIDEDSD